MAVFKPGTPSPAGKVVQGILYVQPAASTAVFQQANNNRATKSATMGRATSPSGAAFLNLNTAITNLDAGYESLPDKSPWITYAANIAGEWQLCANCMPDAGAKKLYRQYNFNRGLIGQAAVSAPVDDTAVAVSAITQVSGFSSITTGPVAAFIAATGLRATDWVIPSIGASLQNPPWQIDATQLNVPLLAGTGFDWYVRMITNPVLGFMPGGADNFNTSACFCDKDGAPGLKAAFEVSVEYVP